MGINVVEEHPGTRATWFAVNRRLLLLEVEKECLAEQELGAVQNGVGHSFRFPAP